MARLNYADSKQPATLELVDDIVKQRGELLHLYQMLLHSPPIAEGWLKLMTAIRQQSGIPGHVRELVIIKIGYLNGADYVAEQHIPIALKEGASTQQLEALHTRLTPRELFDARERSALNLAEDMTLRVGVSDETWLQVKNHWNAREIVELTAIIASYNMVSRFLRALEIHGDDKS